MTILLSFFNPMYKTMKHSFSIIAIILMFVFATTNKTQAQITSTGMAIQGIARDGSNNAITNLSNLGLKFTIHYTKAGSDVALTPSTATLSTDAFGIFSHILDLSGIDNSLFYDYQLKLKIEQTSPASALISDEDLSFVPYAVSASNGVPTGSIMPYIGTIAPRGWVLCDGSALPSSAITLIAMIGNNAPNLNGMFLRGAGTNSNYTNNVGPSLKAIQTDAIKTHASTVTDPGHLHAITDPGHVHGIRGSYGDDANDGQFDSGQGWSYTNNSQSATTGITVNTKVTGITVNYSGASESRPINYGVNYIIKL